ncbi:MAG: hypothetical protein QOK02_3869 [Mycobacterium sp.]|jgi:hypothetical protein|nr:hypothetical protein [Mycobacterium sp.]
MRKALIALCVAALMLLPACSRDRTPNSLFDAAGYHVTHDAVYYLNAFPGKAFQIEGADVASFQVLDQAYARDASHVYLDGAVLLGADTATFRPLERPGFAKDGHHVYQRNVVISSDPAHFELLDGELAKDGAAVYRSDGSVLSRDPAHFVIISNLDHYLFTKDSKTVQVNGSPVGQADPATFRVLGGAYATDGQRFFYFTDRIPDASAASFRPLEGPYAADAERVYWMGKVIDGADPATFQVLNANFECSADARRAYYRRAVIAHADPRSFSKGRAVTGCSETSITFAG